MKNFTLLLLVSGMASCTHKTNENWSYDFDWKFRKQGEASWMPAEIPGTVHTDLLKNNIIEDPYRNNNELMLQWIENENWEYQSVWKVDNDLLSNDHIELNFQGLDTYAQVTLNDTLLFSSDNMFREWPTDVKPFLKEGDNKLSILFTSPLNKNKEIVRNYPYQLPSGNETVNLKVSSFTRKAAYHFGWDWRPRLVTSGVWRPVEISTWNESRITDVHVNTLSIHKEHAIIETAVSVESDLETSRTLNVNGEKKEIEIQIGPNEFKFQIKIDNPDLWWPNGYGDPVLHEMNVQLLNKKSMLEERNVTYGIRTIELINELDSIGTSYYFKINGESLFIRGANYIPQDVFIPRVSNDRYEKLISSVKEANMNMLRVWGGGIYENDIFYDFCDQNGILVWQDLMFAGSMYPSEDDFHHTVIEEISDNVKRLRSHPSIALWCGNNEIDVAWKNWGWQKSLGYSASDSTKNWNNYVSLFQDKIPITLENLTPSINYISTSPTSNWGTPENFNHGSMHYWGVWHGREPLENFNTNIPRFMAEYGFQSFPSFDLLSSVIDSSSMNISSEVMENRQKSYIGNEMITKVSEKHFGVTENFKSYIQNSQKTQALAYKMAIQAHRKNKPHCMGTMFWQLNDCWQGPSWSVLDYEGNAKLAYDGVRKWYQQVIVIPDQTENGIDYFLVSDRRDSSTVRLAIDYWDDEDTLFETLDFDVTVPPNGISKVSVTEFFEPWYVRYSLELMENDRVIFTDSGPIEK